MTLTLLIILVDQRSMLRLSRIERNLHRTGIRRRPRPRCRDIFNRQPYRPPALTVVITAKQAASGSGGEYRAGLIRMKEKAVGCEKAELLVRNEVHRPVRRFAAKSRPHIGTDQQIFAVRRNCRLDEAAAAARSCRFPAPRFGRPGSDDEKKNGVCQKSIHSDPSCPAVISCNALCTAHSHRYNRCNTSCAWGPPPPSPIWHGRP